MRRKKKAEKDIFPRQYHHCRYFVCVDMRVGKEKDRSLRTEKNVEDIPEDKALYKLGGKKKFVWFEIIALQSIRYSTYNWQNPLPNSDIHKHDYLVDRDHVNNHTESMLSDNHISSSYSYN